MFRIKKLDKLLLQAFIGPFILTTTLVTFILLIQQLAAPDRLEQLTGKGLGYDVFAELIFFMALVLIPMSLPLAILLGSLITFGNLGEHFELTAIKSSGISLVRALRPIMIFAILLSIFSFWYSDQVLPHSNLQFYRLLWDIKQKSPALSIKEGVFYNGLPNYTVRIGYKYPDGKTLKDVMIYNHTSNMGNREIVLADSGRMYTINDDHFLVLELFRGKSYHDQVGNAAISTNAGYSQEKFVRNTFEKSQMVFNLSALSMKKTDANLFQNHRYMHNLKQLIKDFDSLKLSEKNASKVTLQSAKASYMYQFKPLNTNSNQNIKNLPQNQNNIPSKEDVNNIVILNATLKPTPLPTTKEAKQDYSKPTKTPTEIEVTSQALTLARNIQATLKNRCDVEETIKKEYRETLIEFYKKFTYALACFTMFLIGAPLGAIIKKGGLGVPVLVSVIFFIIYYLMTIAGEKWVKEGAVNVIIGMWYPNIILLACGLFFLKQARNDSRVFEIDMYLVWWDRLKAKWKKMTSKN